MARLRLRLVTRSPREGESSPLARFVWLSLAAHAGLALVVAWFPSFGHSPTLLHGTPIELVGELPSGAAAAAVEPPAATALPQPEPPEPEPPALEPEPALLDPPEPKPKPPKKPPVKKAEPRPAPPNPTPGPPGSATGRSSEGVGDGQASVSGTGLGAPELSWYRGALYSALYRAWQRPIVDALRQPVQVRVSFAIRRDGSITDLHVESPSGLAVLDRSAIRAVHDASPLPALPRTWSGDRLQASIVFTLSPDA